jgi:hypothetical protein
MPRDFTHGPVPPKKLTKDAVGGKMSLAFKIFGTVFLLFWMAMPTRALFAMLSKEKLASLREAPFPAVIMILILSIFPIAGLAGLISIWRRRAPTGQSAEESPLSAEMQPVQPPVGKASGRRLGIVNFILPLFGTIFIAIGVFAGKVQLDKILARRAINWQTATGTVLSSEVRHKDKGYGAYVSYRYVVDGKTFENDKLSPTEFTTSQRSDIVRHVAKYKPGAEVTVHYNQANPSESLLEPTGTMEYALLLFPIPFILFGLVALVFGLKILLPSRTSQSFDTPLTGLQLKRTGGDSGVKILFTSVWCVFTFVFTTIWFTSAGGFSWTRDFWTFDKFFVLIFPAIGIALAVSCVRDVIRRALTGRYEIEIACDRLRPGARVQVTYKFNGDASRLRHVVFSLTQQSMAMQRSTGDMRMYDENPIESKDVVCTIDDPMRAQYGTFTMTIPAAIDSPRIAWRLVVKYAGITDAFRLDVG